MSSKNQSKKKSILKLFRDLLILVLASILIVLIPPFIPEVMYVFANHNEDDFPNFPVSYVQDPISDSKDNSNLKQIYITDGNRLVIPKIGVDTKILEGTNEDVMLYEEGVWHDPAEAMIPGVNGTNLVLGGHRYQYLPPNTTTLYNLDKLNTGDHINIYWLGEKYTYTIYDKFEVYPNEVWIKDPIPGETTITIYTCTPVYTSLRRLVVKGVLEQ